MPDVTCNRHAVDRRLRELPCRAGANRSCPDAQVKHRLEGKKWTLQLVKDAMDLLEVPVHASVITAFLVCRIGHFP